MGVHAAEHKSPRGVEPSGRGCRGGTRTSVRDMESTPKNCAISGDRRLPKPERLPRLRLRSRGKGGELSCRHRGLRQCLHRLQAAPANAAPSSTQQTHAAKHCARQCPHLLAWQKSRQSCADQEELFEEEKAMSWSCWPKRTPACPYKP